MVREVAAAGFEGIELSPRDGLLQHRSEVRPDDAELRKLRDACEEYDAPVVSVFIVQPWASTDSQERVVAVRGLKVAMETARELGCSRLNTELTGTPEDVKGSRDAFLRSVDELRSTIDDLDIELAIEPHPFDFIETSDGAVDLIADLDSDRIGYLYCAAHTFYLGTDVPGMLTHAGPHLKHVHFADTFRPGRYIMNPPTTSRIHQHLDIGQGEVDWPVLVQGLHDVGFSGVATVSPFAWEDDALASLRRNRTAMSQLLKGTTLEHPGHDTRGEIGD
jgi:myo-inositol catabolism protein IolH